MSEKKINKKNKFIEVISISYFGSLGNSPKEDYIALAPNVMDNAGYDTEIISNNHNTWFNEENAPEKNNLNPAINQKEFKSSIRFINYMRKQKNAVIYANARVFLSMICCFFGKYTVFMNHSCFLPKKWWQRQVLKFFMKRFDAIKVDSIVEKEEYIKLGINPNKIFIIPLVIDHEFFSQEPSAERKEQLRKKYGIQESDIIVLFAGNIRSQKKSDTVLKAVKELQSEFNNLKLLQIGKDFLKTEGQKSIQEMASELGITDKVIQTGRIPFEELRDLFHLANVAVQSSTHEGQCLVAFEFASAKLPVCLSDINSFKVIFADSTLFHEPEDPKKLASNIKEYINDKDLVEKHTKINWDIVKKDYDFEVIQKKMEDLLAR